MGKIHDVKQRKTPVRRTIEERTEIAKNKVAELERTQANRAIKKLWVSEFRVMKSTLNKDKTKDYIQKFTAFTEWIYINTGIKFQETSETEIETHVSN